MKERKPKKPAYMIFDNEEEYDKYERGEHYDKNGLRGDEGKLVKPVNHIPMTLFQKQKKYYLNEEEKVHWIRNIKKNIIPSRNIVFLKIFGVK